ncbi:MAG: protein-disulfide reductase DsbD domain-containing protein [Sphingomicrobium sp.]
MILAALALIFVADTASAADPAKYINAELIAESAVPRPGSTILIGIRMTPRPGWHGYWSNPGDSGLAPSVRWTAPAAVTIGPLLHPAPTLLSVGGMSSFVHAGPHVLLAHLNVARSVAPGTAIPATGLVNWAACTASQCVPLHATLTLELIAGDGAKGADAAALQAAARKVPRSAPAGTWASDGKTMRLELPAALRLDLHRARFFPDDNGVFDAAAARVEAKNGAIAISGPQLGANPGTVRGVVSDGRLFYRLAFVPGATAPPKDGDQTPVARAATDEVSPQPAARITPSTQPERAQPSPESPRSRNWPWVLGLLGAAVVAGTMILRARTRG